MRVATTAGWSATWNTITSSHGVEMPTEAKIPGTRETRVRALVEQYALHDPQWTAAEGHLSRFLLVERDTQDGPHWLSSHDSLEAAARELGAVEVAQDYLVVDLVDLDTGESFEPRLSFVPTR